MKNPGIRSYKLFVGSFIFFFFAFPAALFFFNYQVDPNHRYRFSIPEKTLKAFSSSADTLWISPENYDDRAFLKKYLAVANRPEILLLGGSRVANIREEMFRESTGAGFLNASVTAGTMRDYIAIWQMVKQRGFKPQVVFIGIEEQSLNFASQNDRYLSILEHYESFFEKGISPRLRFMGKTTDLKDLLSLQTTLASVRALSRQELGSGEFISRTRYKGETAARTRSLSLLYPASYRRRSAQTISAEANDNGRGELKAFGKWNIKDQRGYDQLRALIRDIKKSGARPIVIGMPYHPEAHRMVLSDPEAGQKLKDFVSGVAEVAGSEKIFFYDAIMEHASDFKEADFLDGVHLRTLPNYRLFRQASESSGLSVIDLDFKDEQ